MRVICARKSTKHAERVSSGLESRCLSFDLWTTRRGFGKEAEDVCGLHQDALGSVLGGKGG